MRQKQKYVILDKSYHDLIINIKNYFNSSKKVLYQGRNEIKLVKFGNNNYVVKKFKTPNLFNKIIYSFFRGSKAKRSFDYSNKILNLTKKIIKNNATPKPIGYINFYENYLMQESYYICEHIKNCFEMRELIDKAPYPNWECITKEFATFTYKLHKVGIYHNDYSSGNILVTKNKNQNDKYSFCIVDVNRMIFKPFNISSGFKNFEKLWANDDMLKIISKQYFKLLLKDNYKKAIKPLQEASIDLQIKLSETYCLEQISKYDTKLKNKVLLKRKIKSKIKQGFQYIENKIR
jgi:hypothetical protein